MWIFIIKNNCVKIIVISFFYIFVVLSEFDYN